MTSGLDGGSTGDGYGISISDSQNVQVSRSTCTGLTHAITLGGAGPNSIINRQILIDGNHLTTHRAGYGITLDAHANAELYTFSNNRCFGGISIAGRLGKIIGNDVYALKDEPCLVGFEMVDTEHEISNNRFHGLSYPANVEGKPREQGVLLFQFPPALLATAGPMRIVDNRIVCLGSTNGRVAQFERGPDNSNNYTVIVEGNYIYTSVGGIAFQPIRFRQPLIFAQNNFTRNCTIANGTSLPSLGPDPSERALTFG